MRRSCPLQHRQNNTTQPGLCTLLSCGRTFKPLQMVISTNPYHQHRVHCTIQLSNDHAKSITCDLSPQQPIHSLAKLLTNTQTRLFCPCHIRCNKKVDGRILQCCYTLYYAALSNSFERRSIALLSCSIGGGF